ncbi:hypothetical protein JHK87_017880 [Glycine soja]|nr:hypothetical protein JHK87_017880 [Glycine soja]
MANQNQNQKKNKEDFSLKATTPNISAGRAINLSEKCESQPCNPFVEVNLGSFTGRTRCLEKTTTPEWNQVFAFAKERIQVLVLEIVVKDKDNDDPDEFMGRVAFTICDVPMRVRPDSPLAPQWYKLEDQNGVKLQGELMVSVWMGTQADEAFPEAWHSDASETSGENIAHTRSKVYISPRLWSRPMKCNASPMWNEDLMFVVAEPFDDCLLVTIEQGNPHKHESFGICVVPLKNVQQRIDATPPASVWCNLQKPKEKEGEEEVGFSSKLNMRISLDGGYHVLDEATHYTSDVRPSSKYLCKPSIGVLELGILNAVGLSPMSKENRTDAFCVAKYGPKWVRTRTIVDSLSPKWNEQYTWEVFDPCTVITIVVFHNGNLNGGKNAGGKMAEGAMDRRIGKVRIRLSTLESDRIYSHSYPLINLHTQGARKMGEIQLALDNLRNQAAAIATLRFKRAEPPLSKEVVEYMLDMGTNVWSMRRGKIQFFRIACLLNVLVSVAKQFHEIHAWKNSITTVTRPRYPSHMDMRLSQADTATVEELEEEFDPFPSKFSGDNLKKRYDRLRAISGRVLEMMADLATQGERVQALLSWRDPRATFLFVIFCFVAVIVTYLVPFRILMFMWVTYVLRPPRFRFDMPAVPQNFLRRMPAKSDGML